MPIESKARGHIITYISNRNKTLISLFAFTARNSDKWVILEILLCFYLLWSISDVICISDYALLNDKMAEGY
jgi:hypothetical protein